MTGRAASLVLGALVLCSAAHFISPAGAATPTPRLEPLPRIDPGSGSLSPGGRAQLQRAELGDAPRTSVSAVVDPTSGEVVGRYRARLARPHDGQVRLRMLAGLPALHTHLAIDDATVNGRTVTVRRDNALLVITVGRGLSRTLDVRLGFSYRVPRGESTTGRLLTQSTIGVLTRHPDVLLLGHWFPLWLPPGADADADLPGYGDIGNFAAGAITVRVEVPVGFGVFGGGVQIEERAGEGTTTVTRTGVGLRDLSLVVARGFVSAEVKLGDVTVRSSGPFGTDVQAAAEETAASLDTLEQLYGPYPWSVLEELDVPLGPQVGGMEWPGAIWIDGLGTELDGGVDSVVAHELAHQYWHALVGNDSLAASVIDEPLAQYSACLVAQGRGGGARSCRFGGRVLPGSDGPCIDRPTDAFAPGEYGDLVYGEAPAFYTKLEELVGRDAAVGALRAVVERHAFGTLTTAQLRDELAAAVPEYAGEVRALWDGVIGPPGCRPSR